VTRIRQFTDWIGPGRARLLFILLALTGLASLILNAVNRADAPWATLVQSALVVLFLIGAALIIGSRLPHELRRRAAIIIAPAILSLGLAAFFPRFGLLFVPMAVGWVIISFIASGARVRREYQAAIKHMRKAEYDDAIKVMSALIEEEPNDADHYHFRASLYRLKGSLKRARADYQKIIQLLPESGIGYNGLAEVYLQDGEYADALPYAQKAYQMERTGWVAPYNLGMVEERLGQPAPSTEHLRAALKAGIPDSRHRLLTHLWLLRNAVRTGDDAERELAALRGESAGMREWKTIFESDQAAVLKAVLKADVLLSERLIEGEIAPRDLFSVQTA